MQVYDGLPQSARHPSRRRHYVYFNLCRFQSPSFRLSSIYHRRGLTNKQTRQCLVINQLSIYFIKIIKIIKCYKTSKIFIKTYCNIIKIKNIGKKSGGAWPLPPSGRPCKTQIITLFPSVTARLDHRIRRCRNNSPAIS